MIIVNNSYAVNTINFPNGEHSISVNIDFNNYRGDVSIEWKYENDQEIFSLLQLATMIPDTLNVCCNIPYLPYSRMDRIQDNNPFSLEALVKILPKNWEYSIMEPHSYVTVKLFEQEKLNLTINWFMELSYSILSNFPAIVLPDKGALNRYTDRKWGEYNKVPREILKRHLLNDGFILLGSKVRNFSTGKIESISISQKIVYNENTDEFNTLDIDKKGILSLYTVSGECDTCDTLIVDDLCSYGGTFVKIVKELDSVFEDSDHYFSKVYLLAAHVENSIYKGFLCDYLHGLYTTDSILTQRITYGSESPFKLVIR